MFHPGLAVHMTAAAGGRAFAAAAPMIKISRNGHRARQADRQQNHKQADTGRQRHDTPQNRDIGNRANSIIKCFSK